MRKGHLVAGVLAALAVAAMPGVTRAAQADRRVTVLPYRATDGRDLLVQVRLNDRLPVTFVFDTGSTTSVLAESTAERLGLASRPALEKDGAPRRFSDGTPAQVTTVPVLRLGSLEFRDLECALLPGEKLRPLLGLDVDGILGMDVLAGCAVLLDFEVREITLWSEGNFGRQRLSAAGMEGAAAVPLADLNGNRRFFARASFGNGIDEHLLVDTGAEYTAISRETAEKLKLQPYRQRERQGLFGTKKMAWSRAARIFLGSVSLRNHLVGSPTQPGDRITPLLGVDLLSHFRVLLDFPGEQMYLKPVREADPRAVTLPLEKIGAGGMPAVRATLADGHERLFLLVMDLPDSLLNIPAGTQILRVPEPAAAVGASVRTTVRLGGERAEWTGARFRIVDFTEYGLPPEVEGILGADFLANFALTLDLRKGEARLLRDGGLRQVEPVLKRHAPIRLRRVRRAGWSVPAAVNGVEAEFRLDSWEERSVLGGPLRARLELKPVAESRMLDGGTIHIFRTREIVVGQADWREAVLVADPEHPEGATNTLALDFLGRHQAVFDFPAGELYLLPSEHLTGSSVRDLTDAVGFGLSLELDRDGRQKVTALLAPSPVEAAGIALGDEVVAIDGREVRGLTKQELDPLLTKKLGEAVVLRVRKPGVQPREVTLRAAALLR